jgi:hypothetical protein
MVALGWERVGIRTHGGFRRGYRHVSHGITSSITPK